MWCGQSFRTLAEMTQHMKVTQHYTNIISQEQITSWRQPENSETTSKHGGGGKQSSHHQVRNFDDNHDDSSDKYNESDRDDSFSNDDDDLDQIKQQHQLSITTNLQSLENIRNDIVGNENNPTIGSNCGDSSRSTTKGSPNSKPVTRSKKRESETFPVKREKVSKRDSSPATSSSSQKQNNIANTELADDSNEELSEANKITTIINGNSEESTEAAIEETLRRTANEVVAECERKEQQNQDSNTDNEEADAFDKLKRDENRHKTNGDSTSATTSSTTTKTTSTATPNKTSKSKRMTNEDSDSDGAGHNDDDRDRDEDDDAVATADDNDDDVDDDDRNDMKEDEQRSETSESVATPTSGAKTSGSGQVGGGQVGDPLSALETMVEKSFDPRLRPGVANGGILQRLGIDEEVCPPWQHINYANWYAAAAYGHPMAAALLAAGINLQNGIKLSKNVAPKKNED